MEAFKTKDKELITMLKDRSGNDKEFLGKVLVSQLESGNREEINLLIERGASVNEQSERGMTSLMIASQQGDLNLVIVKVLLQAGAKVDENDESGLTALMIAINNRYEK